VDNTQYSWRIVSSGTPVAVGSEHNNRTMSKSGITQGSSQVSTPTVLIAVQQDTVSEITPVSSFENFENKVLGVKNEVIVVASPTPTPKIMPISKTDPKSRLNLLVIIFFITMGVGFLGLKFWRK
jgi:hypothetical protein